MWPAESTATELTRNQDAALPGIHDEAATQLEAGCNTAGCAVSGCTHLASTRSVTSPVSNPKRRWVAVRLWTGVIPKPDEADSWGFRDTGRV
jgi:hypothetical protein